MEGIGRVVVGALYVDNLLPNESTRPVTVPSFRIMTVSCRPTLYIYDLPPRYRDDREGGFGAPVSLGIRSIQEYGSGVRLWQTAEFGLGELFLRRARAYRCRTGDAAHADLLFVPAFSSRQHNRPTERLAESGHLNTLYHRLQHIQGPCIGEGDTTVRKACAALEARGGADHILVNPRNGATYETHPFMELDYMDVRWGSPTLLDLMEPGDWAWFGDYKPTRRYHSVPHPSLVHLEPDLSQSPWRSTHRRDVLIVGAFGVTHGPRAVGALRTALQRACGAAPDTLCSFHRLDGDKVGSMRDGGLGVGRATATKDSNRTYGIDRRLWLDATSPPAPLDARKPFSMPMSRANYAALRPPPEPSWYAIARSYWNGKFCLQPPGDAVSRKAIVDSVLLGCIPVLFHEGQARQWPWHWGAWRENASVLVDMRFITTRRMDPIHALAAIPSARVAHMQATITRHAHVMQYSVVETVKLPYEIRDSAAVAEADADTTQLPDAFDVTMRHAWARARDSAIVALGVRAQQADGARLGAALALFDKEPYAGNWGGMSSGTCSRTWGAPGDCELGHSGTWRLGASSGVVSIDDCAAKCFACPRCQWISHSHAHGQCDWYAACNTSKLGRRFGGETFRTRRIVQSERRTGSVSKYSTAVSRTPHKPKICPASGNKQRPGQARASGSCFLTLYSAPRSRVIQSV